MGSSRGWGQACRGVSEASFLMRKGLRKPTGRWGKAVSQGRAWGGLGSRLRGAWRGAGAQ